jgi:catechol 2,3-dioxygenase-like lactoylglutathione lyase family enzyme
MSKPTHAGLRHLALKVTDLEAMKRFYVEVLGFAVEWEPDADNVYLSSGIDNLALHRAFPTPRPSASAASPTPWPSATSPTPPPSAPASMSEHQRLDHLGLIVRHADDVDRWAAFLESRGVTLDAKPRTHRDGARSCYFRDPDGNVVQIIHHPPISDK